MSATAAASAIRERRERPVPLLVVGIVIFLGSELMFFAALFGMYFTLRAQAPSWPPPGTDLPLALPTVFTTVLVASSFTMQTAVRRIQQGNVASMRRWILLTSSPDASGPAMIDAGSPGAR